MERRNVVLFVLVSLFYGVQMSFANNKPSELPQGMFCEGCIATVNEINKKVVKVTGESREIKVVDAMEDICNLQNFGSYDYSPPKTGQACKYLIENYDEEIEGIFITETKDLEQKICYELTKACEGVDRSKKDKEKMEVRINDEKQPLQRGSAPAQKNDPETMHVDINDKGAADKLIQQINDAVKKKKDNELDDEDIDDEDMDDEDMTEDDIKEESNLIEENDLEKESDLEEDTENLTDNTDKTEL